MAQGTSTLGEHWRDVDRSGEAAACTAYLDRVRGLAGFHAAKQRSYTLLQVQAGQRVLDVGCGTGEDVRALAELVGSTGQAVGVDASAAMIREAEARSTDLAQSVAFKVMDAHRLDFADATFDSVRAERVLLHTESPGQVLAEMVRVTRSGGRVVAAEADIEAMILYAPDPALARTLPRLVGEGIRHPRMGQELRALFLDVGLVQVAVEPVGVPVTDAALAMELVGAEQHLDRARTAGVISAAEANAWLQQLQELGRADRFLCTLIMFIVAATKP